MNRLPFRAVAITPTKERSGYLDFSPPYFVPRSRTDLTSKVGAGALADFTNPYGFSSRNDWPELGSLLTKALSTVSATERDTIRRRWLEPNLGERLRPFQGWAAGAVIAGLLILAMRRYRQRVGRFLRGSIRRNLILVVIVSAMPSLGIILYAGLENRRVRLQAATHEAGQLAAQTSAWVERLARQIHQSLATLAQVAGLRAADARQLESNANALLQSQRMLDVFVFNRRGDVVAAGRPDLVGKINLAQLEIAQTAIQHRGFVMGASVMSATYGQPMIHFALPLGDGPNASNYFLGKAAQLDTWGLEFDRTRFAPGTTLAITDRRGRLLYRYPSQASATALGQPIEKFLWDAVSGASVSGVVTRPAPDGTPWLLAYRQLSLDTIPSADLYLLVSVPRDRLLAGANRMLGRDLLLLLLATLGAILIAVVLGNRMLLNLLDRIAVVARAVGAGDRSARVGLSVLPKGELGELAITIDAMAANLERDETQRARAEAQIQKLSSAVEQSPVSIVIADATGAIEYVNPKFTRLTGYTLDEVRGRNPRLLKGGKTSADEYRRLWESITQGRAWRGEFHNRKKSGEMYWELASISPIVDEQGRITHFLAVKEDITERKVLEAQFQQAQKMESVGQLAGGVAHDFNNILAAIMMQLSFLREDPHLDAETQEQLKEVLAGAKRAADLTRQLLIFSRRSVLEAKALDLNEVVANLLKMLGRLIGEHITVRFERRETLPAVEADPGMIEQVVMNLAVNARDAMPNGGCITIRLEPVQVDADRVQGHIDALPGAFVCLSVTDNGCGMDEATLKRVFEPFFTTKEPGKGTGLGLATVYGIATQHKGWVEAASELGKGTTFRVFLPATTKGIVEPTPTVPMAPIRGHETILLVEDEAILRRMLTQVLRGQGYRVLEADNGHTAMRLWREHSGQIALLFSDMVMPEGMTGWDLADKLKAEKPDLQVIISSGYNAQTAYHGRPTAGGITYLQKPYEAEVLSKTIRDCLDRA